MATVVALEHVLTSGAALMKFSRYNTKDESMEDMIIAQGLMRWILAQPIVLKMYMAFVLIIAELVELPVQFSFVLKEFHLFLLRSTMIWIFSLPISQSVRISPIISDVQQESKPKLLDCSRLLYLNCTFFAPSIIQRCVRKNISLTIWSQTI